MKLRAGFVSNSSTTSFTCDACGYTEAYHDSAGYEDMGFNTCANGHELCDDDLLPLPDDYVPSVEDVAVVQGSEMYAGYEDEEQGGWTLDELDDCYHRLPVRCPICQFQIIGEGDLGRYLTKTTEATREEAFAEVKRGNGRRKKLYEAEWIDFAARSVGKGRGDVVDEIRERFANYAEFAAFLNAK